jgi:hypothetical protein
MHKKLAPPNAKPQGLLKTPEVLVDGRGRFVNLPLEDVIGIWFLF